MTDRTRGDGGVVAARPELGGGAATPSFRLPDDAPTGIPGPAQPLRIGPATFDWGTRTYVMGILNVTPDSFSGDGLLAGQGADPVERAVAIGRRMVEEGADLLDVGGESTRPGHETVGDAEEIARVVPILRALRAALPSVPLSIDTTKVAVAAAALDAGADLVNDVWGVGDDESLLRLAADRGAPIVLMHNRAEARYANLMAEILADLQRAIERAVHAGIAWESIVIDPGFGFGKTAVHNLVLLRELASLRVLGRPILLGTSRKSTLGKVLDLPPDDRVEATLATTALGIAAGVDIVRVHDVRPNVRAARMADAIVRGWEGGAS
jgi:dihydropteroate synthase